MDINWQRLLEGFLLSFVFLFFFAFFIYGSQFYLLPNDNQNNKEVFLGSIVNSSTAVDYNEKFGAEIKVGLNDTEAVEPYRADINAKSAISIKSDLGLAEQIIFEKNKNLKLPIASLTKLMTAVVVFENYNLSEIITVSQEADSQLAMQTDFNLGDTFPIEKFLHIMLIESSNKAAYALSEQIGTEEFISLMNQKAKEIGMENTFFADPTGLSSENVSTINDLVILVKYILKNYSQITKISTIQNYELENFGKIINTNQLLTELPETILSKTGYTNYANGCLLMILNDLENNNYSINIILGADDRFSEMRKLINWKNNN